MLGSKLKAVLTLLAPVIVLHSACKREEEVPPHEHGVAHTVDLKLKFVFMYGSHDYDLGSEYTDAAGRLYRLDAMRFLLSGLDAIDDGSNVLASYPGVNLLVDAAQASNEFAIGPLTAVHGHQCRFNIGLDQALNDSDPATSTAPLDDPDMHWGMGGDEGYWFLVLEGVVDSDNSGSLDGSDETFSYRCGTDALLRSGWATMHADLPDGGAFIVEVPVDVERLMAPVDIMAGTEALGGTALNVQLMDSLAACFQETH